MLDVTKLSATHQVRRLSERDADDVLALCRGNPLFYKYCEAEGPSREQVLSDLRAVPPGKDLSAKYYIGFFRDGALTAVMDLIDAYPEPEIAFIGFFVMERAFQGRGEGSAIIRETADYLKSAGKTAIRLAIDKGNPQSTRFWKKNGFDVICEVSRDGGTLLVAEKKL